MDLLQQDDALALHELGEGGLICATFLPTVTHERPSAPRHVGRLRGCFSDEPRGRGWLGTRRCGLCICEESLEGGEDGGAVNGAELAQLERLLVSFEDGGVGLAVDVETRDWHGVAVDLALSADSSPLQFAAVEEAAEVSCIGSRRGPTRGTCPG